MFNQTRENNYTQYIRNIVITVCGLLIATAAACFLCFSGIISGDRIKYCIAALAIIVLLSAIIIILLARKIFNNVVKVISQKDEEVAKHQAEVCKHVEIINNLTGLYNSTLQNANLKTEFFSDISHEFRTPITTIYGAIQLIEQKKELFSQDHTKLNNHLKTMKVNCYRLLRLVNNILDITRIDTGHVKTSFVNCNIIYLVEEIVQSVAPYAERKNQTLEFDTEIEEVVTAVDIDKIERVMLNLLSNAIKFTPQGGKISVYMYSTSDKVYISVRDAGPGIPENMQKIIFERFGQVSSSLTREFEGSGIGLSIVKSFVDLHNGTIRVVSEENKGSEFIIELPVKLCEENTGAKSREGFEKNKIIETINIEFSTIYHIAS